MEITPSEYSDLGSESSFFHPALLPFSLQQRQQSFKFETLACSTNAPETDHGVEAVFEVAVPGGGRVQPNLLKHMGLEKRTMGLKPKLLTCPVEFADKYSLPNKGLTESCPQGQHRHMRNSSQLSIILRVDIGHIAPEMVETYEDSHGYLAL